MTRTRYPVEDPRGWMSINTRQALLPARPRLASSPAGARLHQRYAARILGWAADEIPLSLATAFGPHSWRVAASFDAKCDLVEIALMRRGREGLDL